ncbi:MAG: hypothetical protein ACRDTG_30595 [Pseudonocardiaceae bacterium]
MATSDRTRASVTGRVHAEPDLLGIYLNDHFAGATGAIELVRRAARSQRGSSAGEVLERLTAEIVNDRVALLDMMIALDIPVQRVKSYVAWAAEKVGRLKLNGYVLSRSPLSLLVELEALRLGVEGKAAAWRTLRGLADDDRRLQAGRLDELLARARQQSDTLEELRVRTANAIFKPRRGC